MTFKREEMLPRVLGKFQSLWSHVLSNDQVFEAPKGAQHKGQNNPSVSTMRCL